MSQQNRVPAPAAILPLALAAALLAAPAPVRADDVPPDEETAALDRVVVTASRTAQPAERALAAVTVIDRERIERLQPASLQDLLRGEVGVSIANNGGAGKLSTMFVRGTESDHVLVLVDGLRVGAATAGLASFQDIPVEQIERIEIVRGPFSSLYGADAIGGVVQVFTRRPAAAFQPSLFMGAGSDDTQRYGAGVSGRRNAAWYSLQAAHDTTAGIDAYRGNPAWAAFETPEPDRDGYRNSSLSLRAGTRVGEAWTLEAHGLRAEGFNEYDGSFVNESDVVQQIVGSRVRYSADDALAVTLNLGRTVDISDSYRNGRYVNTFETWRDIGSLQADVAAGGGLASMGLDWWRDEVESTTAFVVRERITRGLFAQWQRDAGAHAFRFGARRDEDSQFGGRTTGSASWGWDFAEGLRLVASVGTAFKAPSFNELYFPYYGIPTLRPETSRSAELGLRGRAARGGWSVQAFDTRVDDLIVHNPALPPFGGPDNIGRARIRGVEASADARLAGWQLRGSATWLDPRNASGGAHHGNWLPRRARLGGRIDVDRDFGAFSAGASVTASGERFDDAANAVRVGGHAVADLRLGFDVAADWSLLLTATNVFDRRYETAAFYNQPGRGWFLGLRHRPAR
ncbi:MAG: TonB-dependent vitamin B12 receptor [Pseudomonadota bacterium]